MRITKVVYVKNVKIKETQENFIFPLQDIIEIHFNNGDIRILDLFCDFDITDIKRFEVLRTDKTKEKIIFKEGELI